MKGVPTERRRFCFFVLFCFFFFFFLLLFFFFPNIKSYLTGDEDFLMALSQPPDAESWVLFLVRADSSRLDSENFPVYRLIGPRVH